MQELDFLNDLVVIFVAALAVVTLLGRLRVPSIAGYIVAGILVGPGALGLIDDMHRVEVLAEVGVVLLLFGVGLELSLERIRKLWRAVVVGGAIQVGITIVATLLVARGFDLPFAEALFLGFVVAVSSTAIVLRGLSSRGELDAPHGRLAVGILIFQDVCVVPMMLSLPFLSGTGGSAGDAWLALGTAVLVLGGALVATRIIAPPLLALASRGRQRDVFVLTVTVICLGMAWAVSHAGVAVALGAFLAGLVVSGSDFRDQALSEVIPLREVLASVFFVSIGVLLDMRDVSQNIGPILTILAAIVGGKFLLVFLTAAVMRLPLRVCMLTGVALCQVGEFSFVLLKGGQTVGLIADPLQGNLVVAVILSMLVTPFLISVGPRLAAGVGRITLLTRLLQVQSLEEDCPDEQLSDHVIIAGYGITGQELARSLGSCGMAYVVVDLNVDNVRLARQNGLTAYFGDITSQRVLESLAISRARELVVAINDPDAARRTIRIAREFSKDIRIIVRTTYQVDAPSLLDAGANEVVSSEIEAAVEIVYLILKGHGAGVDTVKHEVSRIRSQRIGRS